MPYLDANGALITKGARVKFLNAYSSVSPTKQFQIIGDEPNFLIADDQGGTQPLSEVREGSSDTYSIIVY